MSEDARVQVALRCRPRNTDEKMSNDPMALIVEENNQVILNSDSDEKTFTFDHTYSSSASQAQIFEDLAEPIVDKALEGFNGTIFAYGQTGSGKTYTMMGEQQSNVRGLIPLTVTDLFNKINAAPAGGKTSKKKFLVAVSYLEIYNEVVKDLLNPSSKHLKIREHPDIGIYVEGLAELVVKNEDEVSRILEQGNRVRRVAETSMNTRSSRSHSCFTLRIEQKTENTTDGSSSVLRAKLNLVDLAGSERPDKTGNDDQQLLKEGAAINKSLSALGNVINALSKSSSAGRHVPYRNSKLTRLLQESLGGNSLTVMIATVAPTAANYAESASTLQFAERAKDVKNEARPNEDATDSIVRELRSEIQKLRAQLDAASASTASGGADIPAGASEEQLVAMEETIANLTRAKQQTWQEKERLSKLFYEERERNLRSEEAIKQSMATIAEEGQAIMRSLAQLHREKNAISGAYKRSKLAFASLKKSLQEDMQTYESQLTEFNAGNTKIQQGHLQAMYLSICDRKQQLAQRRHEMLLGKKRLRANETALEQHKILAALSQGSSAAVEASADSTTKQGTACTNQDEELLKELAAKRRLLANELEEDKKNLELRKSAMSSSREYELEAELIQANSDKKSIQLEAAYLHKIHSRAMSSVRREFKQQQRADQRHSLHMLREMCECFEDERCAMKAKHDEFATCLEQAVSDIQLLSQENDRLRALLKQANSTGS